MDIFRVVLSKQVKNELKKVPHHIAMKLFGWIELVGEEGLREARKIKSYHDEPLKGKRKGQRSIRLNQSYRAIYEINDLGEITFIEVVEVNHHEY